MSVSKDCEAEEDRYVAALRNAVIEVEYAQYVELLKAQDEKDYEKAYISWCKFYNESEKRVPNLPIHRTISAITYTIPMSLDEWKKLSDVARAAKIIELSA